MTADSLARLLASIDTANARDSRRADYEGKPESFEWAYGRRMSAWVERLAPDASPALRVAARGQHIERWTSPRQSYPEGRGGYLRWREDLKKFHARRLGELARAAGADATDVARIAELILKKNRSEDPEGQVLEDAACLVFLETELEGFLRKTEKPKLLDILRKTWAKMGPRGRAAAAQLTLSPDATALLREALS
jgi:hypothetical protein